MSHSAHAPKLTREEILAGTSAPVAGWIKTACIVLAAIGLLAFVAGLFLAPDRAWQSLHFNWLMFTTISSAGVMFVAVQRIATARWSRTVIRFLEGYVAWLPAAFVILLLLISFGKGHIFPWMHEPIPGPEKQLYLGNTLFFSARVIIAYAIITLLSLWYIYTSVRLDVGHSPEAGASWARGLRDRMRRGFRDERREIHSTHSLQGKLAVGLGFAFVFGWIILAWDLSMSLDPHFFSTMYGWWEFMSGWVAMLASFTLLTMAWRKHLGRYDMVT
ncbi:MAG TPA: hypothetical protein VMY38_00350, partial [Gemmatimonadaceae bacterium]|nr:hypothetical protein [Gemmatimonadaceae bacterium]